MNDSRPDEPPPTGPTAAAGRPLHDRAASGWRRTRAAIYLAFAGIAAGTGWQAWHAEQVGAARAQVSQVARIAGQHRALTQRIGRQAALLALQPDAHGPAAVAMAQELAQSREEALRIVELSKAMVAAAGGPEQVPAALRQAWADWQDVRERLWYRAESLLSHVHDGRLELVPAATAAVQTETDRAAVTAQVLVDEMQGWSGRMMAAAAQSARGGMVLTLGMLLLALAVIAPALRMLQQQARRLAQQAAENERLALVAERTSNIVMITDRERRIVWVNEAFTRVTGYELHEVLGANPGRLLLSDRADAATVARLRATLDDGQGVRVELLNRSRDGRDYWTDTDIQPLRNAAGELTGFITVETDITAQVTQRLRSAALLAAMPTAVVVHGPGGEVVEANRAAQALLGVRAGDPADALLQRGPLHEDLEPMDASELPVPRSLRSGRGERGRLLGLDDGEGGRRWLLANTAPLQDALGHADGVVACYVDMTERRRLLDQLSDSARRDPLTRMPNRTVVLERVQRAIDHRRRHPGYGFAVLFMDVDRFKQVNDTLGHGAGDELLRQVAARLEDSLRPGDAVARVGSELHTAARIGGDEFVIVLEGIHHTDEACRVAERLLQELSRPYQLGPHVVHVSVSIGIVGAEQAGDDAGAVLRDCDTAMYEAKRGGRGRWMVFDASMHERVRAALELEGELRRALKADELHVVYQPVVDLGDRRLAGVEALVRWRHPTQGEIAPGRFIALAEECGLIDAIGEQVLAKACAQFMRWRARWGQRAPALLAVNLSRAQLRQPGLVPEVQAVLQANGMRPEQLQLEVTESFAAQDEQVQATLRALKAAGVRLALDDFGTGYSSLACLHLLPVDTVKVDRSFVAHAREVEYHRVLISATIRMARTLGMTTVAEGIETEDQAALMAELDCDRGQGWLFGRPMPPEALDRWIEAEAQDSLV
jgi:diguanylate cyclase (GGDEF)-like protein/PAS domain S-box-containing protein